MNIKRLKGLALPAYLALDAALQATRRRAIYVSATPQYIEWAYARLTAATEHKSVCAIVRDTWELQIDLLFDTVATRTVDDSKATYHFELRGFDPMPFYAGE